MNRIAKILILTLSLSSCSNFNNSNINSFINSNVSSVSTNYASTIEGSENIELIKITEKINLKEPQFCMIESTRKGGSITSGFPIPVNRIPTTGEVNIQAFFIDFPDFKGTRSEIELSSFFNDYILEIDDFYTTQSNDRLKLNWKLHPGFITLNENFYDYNLKRGSFGQDNQTDFIFRKSIEKSDSLIDYTDTDLIIVFLNPDIPERLADVSPAFPFNEISAFNTDEGKIYNGTFIAGDAVRNGSSIVTHEIGHLLGLDDLYNYRWRDNNPTNDYLKQFIFVGFYDFMSHATRSRNGVNTELLGWSKFLLNWTTIDQVRCLDSEINGVTTHELTANHLDSGDDKLIVIKLSNTRVLVSEIKNLNSYCEICKGGVYTYIVDSTIESGLGPIRLLKPQHSKEEYFEDAYLSKGQSLVYESIKIVNKGIQNNKVVVEVTIAG